MTSGQDESGSIAEAWLPRSTVHFLGREAELALLHDGILRYAVMAITGVSGIGKTQLALRFAEEAGARHKPVWVVCREGWKLEGLLNGILRGLGEAAPDAQEGLDPSQRCRFVLGAAEAGNALLLLDDFHRVEGDGALELLRLFLQYARSSRVLLTARKTPAFDRVEGLEVLSIHLTGLDADRSERLVGSLLPPSDWARLGPDLRRRCIESTEGHPGYLKLLATTFLGGEAEPEILVRELATAAGRAGRVLLTSVQERLGKDEVAFLERFSIFRAPVDAAALKLLMPEDRTREATKKRLAELFLLEQTPDRRYAMHTMLREHFRQRLGEEARRELHEIASAYYRGRLDTCTDPAELVEAYHHTFEAGLHEACAAILVAHADRLVRAGLVEELTSLLDTLEPRLPRRRSPFGLLRVELLKIQGRFHEALDALAPLEKGASKDATFGAAFCAQKGDVLTAMGRYREAQEVYERGLGHARKSGIARDEAILLNGLGTIHYYGGRGAEGLDLYRKALAIERQGDDPSRLAKVLNNVAVVYRWLGLDQQALDLYEEVLAIDERLQNRIGLAKVHNNMAIAYSALHEFKAAMEHFLKSLTLKRRIRDRHGQAFTLRNIGDLCLERGYLRRAIRYFSEGLDLIDPKESRLLHAELLSSLGTAYERRGELGRAGKLLARAEESARKAQDVVALADVYIRRAYLAWHKKAWAEAERWLDRLLEESSAAGNTAHRMTAHVELARLCLCDRRLDEARRHTDAAEALFHDEGNERSKVDVGLQRAVGALLSGRPPEPAALEALGARCRKIHYVQGEALAERILAATAASTGHGEAADRAFRRYADLAHGLPKGTADQLLLFVDRLDLSRGRAYRVTTRDGTADLPLADVEALRKDPGRFDLLLDLATEEFFVGGVPRSGLFKKKLALRMLVELLRCSPAILAKGDLFERVWERRYNPEVDDNTFYVRLNDLRKVCGDRAKGRKGAGLIVNDPAAGGYGLHERVTFCLIEDA